MNHSCVRLLCRLRWAVFSLSVLIAIQASGATQSGTAIGWGQVNLLLEHSPYPNTNAVAITSDGAVILTADGRVREGGAPPRPELSNIVAVAPSMALRNDGVVFSWQAGSTNPATAIASNAMAIAAYTQQLVLESNGTVLAWGDNFYGQANVPPGLDNVIAIGAGQNNSLAVKSNGTVVAWGDDSFGESDVPPGLSNVIAVAAGDTHSLALKSDGTMVGWGGKDNDYGQENPPPSATNVVAIAAGAISSVALRSDGSVIAWGFDGFGAVEVPPGTNYLAIAGGVSSTWAITTLPVILSQPASETILAGSNAVFSVNVVGTTPWTYQWFFDGTNALATTVSNLVVTNVQTSNSGSYSVILSNQYGMVTSAVASLTVQPYPPALTVQPTNLVQLAGTTATFSSVAAGAAPIYYQWFFDGAVMPGQTNADLVLPNISVTNAGSYMVVLSNAYGTNTSSQAVLTVNYPPAALNPLAYLALPAGTNWILTADVTGNQPIYYQWQFQGTNLIGATNVSLLLTNIQPANAGLYQLVMSNAFGEATNGLYSISVVASPPVILQQPLSQQYELGGTVVLLPLAYGSAPMSAQWSFDGTPLPGATNLSLQLVNLQAGNAGSYSLALSNMYGATTSAVASLSVGTPYPGSVDIPSLSFTPVVSNTFDDPTGINHADDGSGRLFIQEQRGMIWIIQSNSVLPQAFLALTNEVQQGSEEGLLGMTFSPGFATNGRFYVSYSRKPDGATVLSRFETTTNGNFASTNSEQVLLVIPQPSAIHKSGQLAFGPDGYLYVSTGDGGPEDDPLNNAQNTQLLLGKLLRIDPENTVSNYSIPPSNPFVGNTNFAPEIWAYGLRNPWRFSFDRSTGDLYIGDVGQNSWEEVDFQPAGSAGGQNYGWRIMEGPSTFDVPRGFTNFASLTLPVTSYPHGFGGAAVIGGYVFRGPGNPRMDGIYFFGDFVTGTFRGLELAGTNWQTFTLAQTTYEPSSFGEDDSGNLYFANYTSGSIFQITDSRTAAAPVLSPNGGLFNNDQPVTVTSPTPGTTIYYTTDGRDPSVYDQTVSSGGTILVQSNMVLKVRAARPDLSASAVVAATFNFQAAAPSFSPAQGPITNGTLVTISTATSGAIVRFTLDGSQPNLTSPIYSGPLTLDGNTTLNAIASKPGYTDSQLPSQTYQWAQVPAPQVSPPGGAISNGTPVVISCSLPGSQIYYTLDGSVPTQSSSLYVTPIVMTGNTVLNVRAWAPNYAPSPIVTETFYWFNYRPTVVQTFAGQVQAGSADGPVWAAQFNFPQGVCTDPTGNVYVADTGNNLIREITTNGEVFTIAGSGAVGASDGLTTNATFSGPSGVIMDTYGNLFIVDRNNNSLRKMTPNGNVSTLAVLGGPYQEPVLWQAATDTNDNVYVTGLLDVFLVNSNGQFSNYAGPGACCPGNWTTQMGVILDGHGGLFLSVNQNAIQSFGWIVDINSTGEYNVYAGTTPGYTDGPRQIAQFELPMAIARAPDGSIIVSDWTRVRRIDTNGTVSTLAGGAQSGFQNGPGDMASFNQLAAVAVDPSGHIYVADAGNNCIRKLSSDSANIGISDDWQLQNFGYIGINPNADPDGNGMSSYEDFWAGINPLNKNSALLITNVSVTPANAAQITWQSVLGKFYTVESSTDMEDWSPLVTSFQATNTSSSFTDTTPIGSASGRYYRVEVNF